MLSVAPLKNSSKLIMVSLFSFSLGWHFHILTKNTESIALLQNAKYFLQFVSFAILVLYVVCSGF